MTRRPLSRLGALVAPVFIILAPIMALAVIWRLARRGWK